MSVSASIPATVQIRRKHLLGLIGVVAALAACVTAVVIAITFDTGTSGAAPSSTSVSASPATFSMTRKQIEGLSTMSPQPVAATFTMTRKQIEGLSTMAQQTGRNTGSGHVDDIRAARRSGLGTGYQLPNAQSSPTAAAVLASMSPETRRYTEAVDEPHVRAARGRRRRPSVGRRTSRRGADALSSPAQVEMVHRCTDEPDPTMEGRRKETTGNDDASGTRQRQFPEPVRGARSRRPARAGRRCTPDHALFSEDRRAFEESRFWFQDGLHCGRAALSLRLDRCSSTPWSPSTRPAPVSSSSPPSLGVECRLLNGYVYLSANSVTDEATLARRAELFRRRGGYYYEHWDELYERWLEQVEAATSELSARGPGTARASRPSRSSPRAAASDRATLCLRRTTACSRASIASCSTTSSSSTSAMRHTSSSTSGCRRAFPDIPDQTVARMVSGDRRPRPTPRRGAPAAGAPRGRAGRDRAPWQAAENEEELAAALAGSDPGERWLADFEQTKDPWFHFSYGTGVFHHHHRSWIDDTRLPIADDRLVHRAARRRRGHRTPRRGDARRAGAGHRGAPRAGPARGCAMPSTRASSSPARSSRTSRTTTSTSTTATSRSSGTRCASSERSLRATSSWRTRRTSSTSATTRCGRLWRSCGCTGARGA